MGSIFISYRRADAGGHAQNLFDRLRSWFDAESELFFDAENIDCGQNFPQRLADGIDAASVVLVLIGPGWLDTIKHRAANPTTVDFVRLEVERALARIGQGEPVLVVPILMAGAEMPPTSAFKEVHPSLAPLCELEAHSFGAVKQVTWDFQFALLRKLVAAHAPAPRERLRDRSGAPRPWRVIEHSLSAHFQDPNALLQSLRAQLQGGGTAAVVGAGGTKAAALHGMGGIGKTQLALAYSYTYRDDYAGVWWLRAESSGGQNDTLLQQDALAACAAAGVAVPEGESPSLVFERWLGGQQTPWLLVFDNADDPKALRRHLTGPGLHHVLITSRRPDWGALAKTVELQTWTPQQGANFLVQRLGIRAARAEAEVLAREMGGLPLALDQAASYIETTGGTVGEYLALWREAAADLLKENEASTGYELTVAASLSLAFGRLSPAAQQLLRLCAFAAPEPLPERFFIEEPEDLPDDLRAAALNRLAWNRVAAELKGYALVQRETIASLDRAWLAGGQVPDGTPTELALMVHRLTQQVVRDRLAEVPGDDQALLWVLVRACPRDAENPAQWSRLAALLPHAVWVNDVGSIAAMDEPPLVAVRTELLNQVSVFMRIGLALYSEARVRSEQAFAIRNRVLGEEHPDTLISMDNLASTLRDQGDLDRARILHEQVLAVRIRVLGEEHVDTLTSMNNLAGTLRDQGDLEGARILHGRELAICRRVMGEEHLDTLTSMNNLAGTLRDQGDLDGARILQDQVLAIMRRVLGEEHPYTLSSMNNLALTLSAQGNLEGARILHEQGLAVSRRVVGDGHRDTLISMYNLARIQEDLRELDAAIVLMTQAARGLTSALGADHKSARKSADSLARMMSARA